MNYNFILLIYELNYMKSKSNKCEKCHFLIALHFAVVSALVVNYNGSFMGAFLYHVLHGTTFHSLLVYCSLK